MAKDGRTDVPSKEYKDNWKEIFGKKKPAKKKDAQLSWIEQQPSKLQVAGSNPAAFTKT